MTAHRDPDHLVHAFLKEGQTELADQVYDAVRATIEHRRQRAVIGPWRMPNIMNKFVPIGVGAAAVVVALVVGTQLLGPAAPGGVGGTAPTASPSASTSPTPSAGGNPAGPFVLYDAQGSGPSLTVTLPTPGWSGDPGGDPGLGGGIAKYEDGPVEVSMAFYVVTHVYADACQSEGTLREIGPSPDDLVAALLAQEDIAASGPTDLTIGGYPAQRVDLGYPPGLDTTACRHGDMGIQVWADEAETYFFALASQRSASVYVVDVDGERAVITTVTTPNASVEDIAELEAIVGSVTFGE